jgi:hypothetical protein
MAQTFGMRGVVKEGERERFGGWGVSAEEERMRGKEKLGRRQVVA